VVVNPSTKFCTGTGGIKCRPFYFSDCPAHPAPVPARVSLPFQLAEGEEIEAAENPAVARIERDFFDFTGIVSNEFNSAALGEQVKNALFGAGNVHFWKSGRRLLDA